ncbi:MAG TPA: M24 family metallopeptidase [Planctomycetota bacterium]|nr:M24 family metallopeptidase [Planctomycetota bacterium]
MKNEESGNADGVVPDSSFFILCRSSELTPQEEFKEKLDRVRGHLDRKGLHGVCLTRQGNFAWIACGGENRVVTASEIGAATAFVSRDRICVVADNIEAPRLRQEELAELAIDVLEYEWHQPAERERILSDLAAGNKVASDIGTANPLEKDFDELKYSLTDPEVGRYRWLGRNCSLAIEKVCTEIKPEMPENEIAARLAQEAMKARITPTVILIAADDRAFHYRHPLPTDKKVKEHAMVVFCGRRWGLWVSLTRIVHFGKLPAELAAKHKAVCGVDAAFILNSRPEAVTGEIFQKAVSAYEAAGFPDEWKLHHQGGPTGYEGRYYRVVPSERRTLYANQAVAWNPSIAGTKSEDTVLCTGDNPEILTPCHQWPATQYESAGMAIFRPDILVV